MTVLSDSSIHRLARGGLSANEHAYQEQIKRGYDLFHPYNEEQLQAASYDVLLAQQILVPRHLGTPIDLKKPAPPHTDVVTIDPEKGFYLGPGRFVLGSSQEWFNIPSNMVARLDGKSSLARFGVQIHSAGFIDPGYQGNVTLELVNFGLDTVILYPDIRMGQIEFLWLDYPAKHPYSAERNHYQRSRGVVESRYGHEPGEVSGTTD